MRESTLLFLVLLAGCGSSSPADDVIVRDFRARSDRLACERTALGDELAVTELRATSDSTWAVLDEAQRQIRGFDDRLRPLWTVELEAEGPRALPRPVGLSVSGDTLAYVVDRATFALVALDIRGGPGHAIRLDFIPGGVTALPDGSAAVTALPLGPRPRELLFLVRGGSVEAVDVPQRRYADMSVNGLGNMIVAEADGAGSLVLVHQYLAPRAFRVDPDGEVRTLTVPVPDATAGKRAYIPEPPVTEEDLPFMYVTAAAMTLDRSTGDVYLLTQTGHREDDRSERAIMRLDPAFNYVASYIVDMNAGHVAYLARRGVFVIADDEDAIYACALPDRRGDDPAA